MNWASHAITTLATGQPATMTPHGNSMRPRIESGATVVIRPLLPDEPAVGDAVLVKVKGAVYLHLVVATRRNGANQQYLIGNNKGGINGWAKRDNVYGIVSEVDGVKVQVRPGTL